MDMVPMAVICPKCGYRREASEAAPDWQCPDCGVAYAKASEAGRAESGRQSTPPVAVTADRVGTRSDWARLIIWVTLVWGGWSAWQWWGHHAGVAERSDFSAAEIAALAATVQADEVILYGTTECGYCAQAKAWLTGKGFAFTECNMTESQECEQEFVALGAAGVPYLIVRGHHMEHGFSTDEFLTAIADRPRRP